MFVYKKPTTFKFWHGLVLGVLLALILLIRSCSLENAYHSEVERNLAYKDTVMQYQAKDGVIINYNNALNTKFDAFLEAYGDSIENYLKNIKIPKPDVYTVYSDRVYIDSIPQVGLGITDCNFDTTFRIIDPWYEIDGRVSNEALSLKSIMIPNTSTFVIGDKKDKWWKRSEYIVSVTNTNPHIQATGIQSYTFKDDKSRLSIGPSFGYGFYYDPWKGNAGHGFSANLSFNYRLIGWKKK